MIKEIINKRKGLKNIGLHVILSKQFLIISYFI